MSDTVVAIIQARVTSSRLPGKILLPLAGAPLLQRMLERVARIKKLHAICLAIPKGAAHDPILDVAVPGTLLFRGDETDVLGRTYNAAKQAGADVIMRVTSDCPLIDPHIVSQIISTYKSNNFDYVSNSNIRTYPDGMDVAVFSKKNLQKLSKLTKNKYDLEHLTLFFRRQKKIFSLCNVMAPTNLHYPMLGLTLDERKDYDLIKIIFKKFYKLKDPFTCLDIINFLKKNSHLLKINRKVKRNSLPLLLK